MVVASSLSALSRHRGKAAVLSAVALGYLVLQQRRRQQYAALSRKARGESSGTKGSTPGAGPVAASKKPKRPKQSIRKLFALLVPKLLGPSGMKILRIVALLMCKTLVDDKTARLQGQLFQAVFTKDRRGFVDSIKYNVVWHIVVSFLSSTTNYYVNNLKLDWQDCLYDDIHRKYFSAMSYYKVAFVDKRIQSAEQIITNDVPRSCDAMSNIVVDVIKAVLNGSYFTYRLAQATSPGWSSVSWLYVVSAIAVVSSISPNFGKLHSIRLKMAERFRKAYARLSTHSEAVATLGGDQREAGIVSARFAALRAAIQNQQFTQWWFGMIEDFVAKYCGATMAMVVILGPFFSGRLRSDGSQMGNAKTMAQMRYVTSVIINQLTAIGGLATCVRNGKRLGSYTDRIQGLREVLEDIHRATDEANETHFKEGDCIAFENVDIVTPAGTKLVDDLSFRIDPGTNLLITGPNGAGKSSIFRCLGALWNTSKGSITRPGGAGGQGLHGTVFYLPQKPYNVVGSIRDQLTYPLTTLDKPLADATLRDLLSLVDLGYLLDRQSDQEVNWEGTLSLGETQRLAMARLFYHKPTFAILDECTSAVSTDIERRLYRLCQERGITCITISHRPALTAFHDLKLELDGHGSFSVTPCGRASAGAEDSVAAVRASATPFKANAVATAGRRSNTVGGRQEAQPYSPLPSPVSTAPVGWQRLQQLLKVLVPSWTDGAAIRLAALSGVVLTRVWLSDRVAHLNGNTVHYLLQGDAKGFRGLVYLSLVQCVASAVMAPSLLYLTRQLALMWRARLQRRLGNLYFGNKNFYALTNVHHDLSNPDARISDDLEKLCNELSNTFPEVIKPIIDIVWFSAKARSLIGLRNLLGLFGYMSAGWVFLRLVSPDFSALASRRQNLEAQLRHVQTRLRTHGESVAFFGGGEIEGVVARDHHDRLMRHRRGTLGASWGYDIVDTFLVKHLPPTVTWVLSYMYTVRAAATRDIYADKGAALGYDIRFVAAAVSHLFLAFGDLLTLQKRALELSGLASRVTQLEDTMLALRETSATAATVGHDEPSDTASAASGAFLNADSIVFDSVDVVTPTGTCLVKGVSFTVSTEQQGHLMVTGPNTSGKSSLFRLLAGLWPLRAGTIARPGGSDQLDIKDIFMVPQRPYHVAGTLADQLTYPEKADLDDPSTVSRLGDLMALVSLSYLPGRTDDGWAKECDWEDVLSLGEQQRIGMARLFYHRPRFAVLDQCTDAVSVDVEEKLYEQAEALGITIITISQRPLMAERHSQQLHLSGSGAHWELLAVEL